MYIFEYMGNNIVENLYQFLLAIYLSQLVCSAKPLWGNTLVLNLYCGGDAHSSTKPLLWGDVHSSTKPVLWGGVCSL